MAYEIGIDMGGTHTAIGLVSGTEIIDRVEFHTDLSKGVEGYLDALYERFYELLSTNEIDSSQIEHIGMGVPGNANLETGMVEYANNLGFDNVPFKKLVSDKLGKEVFLDNDANMAAYGEKVLSDSKAHSFLMVTLGTGIGAALLINGSIYRGINFAEGEVGHMTIKYDGIPCNCGRRGCFEAYASASALCKMAAEAFNDSSMDGRKFFGLVKENNKTALEVLDDYTTLLSEGLTNLINIFQPEELVIGGGISAVSELFLPETITKTQKIIYSRNSKKNTLIRQARFGNDAGIVGAAKLRA